MIPSFLHGYEAQYNEDPRAATLAWFREARFGLFIHYGLYSLIGHGEWVQYRETIPIAEYAKLAERFTAEAFDAEFITDLALDAQMRYVNLGCKHCDSYALWDTRQTEFSSVNSPAGRDLVGELAAACERKGLGFFAFYEHGFDWRHPHGPAPWDWATEVVRPHYDPPDPWFAPQEEHDFDRYVLYADRQIAELCTRYGQLAGVWLDGVGIPASGDKTLYRCPELYALIRTLQPQALISYKWGLYPELEDFFAPEEQQIPRLRERWAKPVEICTTLQKGPWGYSETSEHLTPDEVTDKLRLAAGQGANLLLNIGPLGDGSVHPDDVATLREEGRRIRADGWPTVDG